MAESNKAPSVGQGVHVRRATGELVTLPADTTLEIDSKWLLTVTEPGREPWELSEEQWFEVWTNGDATPNRSPRMIDRN